MYTCIYVCIHLQHWVALLYSYDVCLSKAEALNQTKTA